MPTSRPDAERAIRAFLSALGQDPESPELEETPSRVAEAFLGELLSGYEIDIPTLLEHGSEPLKKQHNGVVVVHDIAVATVCPHHLMPAIGRASVAYLPGNRILGLGTIAKLVEAYARRLSLQEQIGANVVTTLMEYGARAAFCRLALSHTCLSARGAGQPHATVVTMASEGEFAAGPGQAALALALDRPSRAS